MVKIIVDAQEIDVPSEYTLLQAAEEAGAEIPRFCYHERLSIAGNCRMCLVEVKGGPPKPTASCAMSVSDLRPGPNGEPPEISTKSEMVKNARSGVMEFLLINHPLDCPICDQGGECDLQDQAMAFGLDGSRFDENKRSVEDKYIGPLVKTIMTRCIHCTRCVRFTTEVAGVSELGLLGRGEDAEITTYLEKSMTSELQGNIIDLCPVGALTSRPYAFQARPWELTKTQTIDVMDAMGSSIRLDSRDGQVQRILPALNEEINEEWITDKTRFHWDGLRTQRLDKPYIRKGGKLKSASWEQAFDTIAKQISSTSAESIGAISGDLSCLEEIYALQKLLVSLGSPHQDCRLENSGLSPSCGRPSYLFNSTIEGIEKADLILLIGTNPRKEAALLNARLYKRWRQAGITTYQIGEQSDLGFESTYLGTDISSASKISNEIKSAERPLFIIGESCTSSTFASYADLCTKHKVIRKDWNGANILCHSAGRVGALDLGFVQGKDTNKIIKDCDLVFLLGADEYDLTPRSKKGKFTIYIGSHGDRGAHHADVILPSAAYSEKSGLWVNLEGRVQMSTRATFPPGEAKEDWTILRALSEVLNHKLPFDSLGELRQSLFAEHPHFAELDTLSTFDLAQSQSSFSSLSKLSKSPKSKIKNPITDFYLTNPIARASKVMAECSSHSQGISKEAAQ